VSKPASRGRSLARSLAVQALYQWQVGGQPIVNVVPNMLTDHAEPKTDAAFFTLLVEGVAEHVNELDEALRPHVDRSLESIDPVERAILRLGAYELKMHQETPYRVVINESIELAKVFGAEQGHKYVNGVLDKAAKDLRPFEMAAEKKTS